MTWPEAITYCVGIIGVTLIICAFLQVVKGWDDKDRDR